MIKVLVVDDDKLARKGLISLMDWEKYGMQVVGSVQNGKIALEFVKNEPVDLVFVDIDMPEMNGLEFMEQCHQMNASVQFVVLSFYERFDYVQSTLRLGGLDYISKTSMDLENCDEVLNRIREKYEEKRGRIASPAETDRREWDREERDEEEREEEEREKEERKKEGREKEEQKKKEQEKKKQEKEEREEEEQEEEEWEKEEPNSEAEAISGDAEAIGGDAEKEETVRELRRRWRSMRWIFDDYFWAEMKKQMVAGSMNVRRMEMIISNCIGELGYLMGTEEKRLPLFDSMDQLILWVEQYRKQLLEDTLGLPQYNDIGRIANTVSYIKENFSRDISTTEVAYRLGVSRSYFCTVFKRWVGVSFGDYLQRLRIDYAREQLEETETSVSEIAFLCGYNDIYYFSRVFRKVVGCAPVDYRNMSRAKKQEEI